MCFIYLFKKIVNNTHTHTSIMLDVQDYVSQEYDEVQIVQMSYNKLVFLEKIYTEYLTYVPHIYTDELIQILNTRDKIICRINKLNRSKTVEIYRRKLICSELVKIKSIR